MSEDEFNPEQRLIVEVMRVAGTENPEAVVRADRLSAAYLGSHLAPVMARMCAVATEAIARFMDLFPVTCSLCLMRSWHHLPLRCEFCGVTAEELHRAGIAAP